MTASVTRRRHRAMAGAAVSFALVLVAGGLTFVGATTIANSTEGAVVQGDVRPVVFLPQTDNAAVAVVDDDNRLTALIVATLLPGGQGGSIVTIPVDADASIGLGDERRPLAGVLDPADPDGFFEAVEGTLAIVLQFGEIVGADRLAELIEPVTPVSVDLPFVPGLAQLADGVAESPVPSTTTATTEVVSDELGDLLQSIDFDVTDAVDVLRSTPLPGTNADRQTNTVAMWSALAAATPVDAAGSVPVDEFGMPVTSSTIDDVFTRLWQGPVQVRDLAVVSAQSSTDGSGVDVSVLDRFDSLLVFAQISPARVSKPNVGLVFRVEVPITDAQLDVDNSPFVNRSDVARSAVGQLLFLQANVASVDVAPNPEGSPTKSRFEVADEKFVADLKKSLSPVFGDAEYVVSEELIAGVDVVMTIGTGYFNAFNGGAVASSDGDADTVVGDG
ncbi:hypothetical protein [Ilumatobacter sp.]|uniref:hypothetical protein n=1 Tax=Ilumatobacter sp. TaxID=1967498 RepID=UPI003750B39D